MNSLDKKPNLDIKYLDEAMRETVINWNDETEKSMLLYFPECELFVSAYREAGGKTHYFSGGMIARQTKERRKT